MSSTIDVADEADLAFLVDVDRHVSAEQLARVVAQGRVLVARLDGRAVGHLRWGLFWDEVPFMNLLHVVPEHRGAGVGSAIVAEWEHRARAARHTFVLTSTVSAETSQHFYRKLGYVDAGVLLLPGEPAELLLRKDLGRES